MTFSHSVKYESPFWTHRGLEILRQMSEGMVWIAQSSLTNCLFHIAYEKRLQRENHLIYTHLPKLVIIQYSFLTT